MADNFDLRQFLTENKLTKNAQLLKEEQEDYKYFDEEGTGGFYMTTIDGEKIYSLEDSSIMDTCFYAIEGPETTYMISIDVSGEPVNADYVEQDSGVSGKMADFIVDDINSQLEEEGLLETSRSMKNKMNEARVEGFDVNKKAFEVSFIDKYGGGDFRILNAETPEQAEEVFTNIFVNNPDQVQSIKSIEPYQVPAPKPQAQSQPGLEGVNYGSIKIGGVDSDDYPDFVDAYVISAEFEDGTPLSEEELDQLTDELYQSGELGDMAAQSLYENNKKPMMKETKLTIKERRLVEMVNEALNKDIKAFGQDLDKNFKAAGFDTLAIMQDPTPEQLNIIKTNEKAALFQVLQNNEAQTLTLHVNPKQVGKAKSIVDKFQLSNYDGPVLGKGWTAKQVKGAINPGDIVKQDLNASRGIWYFYRLAKVDTKVVDVNESRLTAKERRLVEMVNNAMGIQEEEIPNPHPENPNHEFGTNALTGEPLPNPNDTMVVEDEMADETVIPEYNTIDELMNSIDHGTNKVAEEHKIQEMKKIAQMLREKAKKMEESEHAAHISPKDLKQLATDAAKLEKAAEKLKAAFDKKFNKKDKPAAAPKAEKVEALQEGFDLRKFLAENKLTSNSRMVSENQVELPPANREEILTMLQTWTPKRLGQTTDHLLDTIAIEVREAGYDIPQGEIPNLDSRIMAISGKYQGGVISGDEAVDMLVDLVMDRQ
jgi:hypothetical protein